MLIDKHTHYSGALSFNFIWRIFLKRLDIWTNKNNKKIWTNVCNAIKIKIQPKDFYKLYQKHPSWISVLKIKKMAK